MKASLVLCICILSNEYYFKSVNSFHWLVLCYNIVATRILQ